MNLALILNRLYRAPEEEVVQELLSQIRTDPEQSKRIAKIAYEIVAGVRRNKNSPRMIDKLIGSYKLSSSEGLMMMALAESFMRIPDINTAQQLLKDKLGQKAWDGKAFSKVISLTQSLLEESNQPFWKRSVSKLAKPFIQVGVSQFMQLLANKFVMGHSIEEALKKAKRLQAGSYSYSFDMLGEAACTREDADRYFKAYLHAIHSIQKIPNQRDGISVKLSALHPRYSYTQGMRVQKEVIQSLKALAVAARDGNVALTVDGEEADRLEMSLRIFEGVARDPDLQGWTGFGLAVQAYQKRAPAVIDWIVWLAQDCHTRFNVRLVKGAYWDSEIKWTQEKGLIDYPVFTRKVSTDVSFLCCAQKLLEHPNEIYPAFATHNAYSIASILEYVQPSQAFEFQSLYGMGHDLYQQVPGKTPVQIYAPVGNYQDLLPYLVRRLLENGANSSFVNALSDPDVRIETLIADPIVLLRQSEVVRHPKIARPQDLFFGRKNSSGVDLSNSDELSPILKKLDKKLHASGGPIINGVLRKQDAQPVYSPIDRSQIGKVQTANEKELLEALENASNVAHQWKLRSVEDKAQMLERAADLLEANRTQLIGLCVNEGGKTIPDAVSEVREAVDFCRYYAEQARINLSHPLELPGPTGEKNMLYLRGRGVFLCISPWNFPLAIFTGQVVAALVSGNCVLAKPSSQTVLIATQVVQLMHQAGIPSDVLHLIPGSGRTVGNVLLPDHRIAGICFTGSTETALSINQTLATRRGPITPFIAETGGQNAMIVDSTALPEQVVADVLASAFNSAGQRCSALRLLLLQEEIAPKIIEMLKGAMVELNVGDPRHLSTDVGPVIDEAAMTTLDTYIKTLAGSAELIFQTPLKEAVTGLGTFVAPSAFHIRSLDMLREEHFGPILHIMTYKSSQLEDMIQQINQLGFGLTFGLHTRINSRMQKVFDQITFGNMYVNRNMIGAVVGVQPFGGQGLSGTGPKAGGPHYLYRFMHEHTLSINTTAQGGNATLLTLEDGEA